MERIRVIWGVTVDGSLTKLFGFGLVNLRGTSLPRNRSTMSLYASFASSVQQHAAWRVREVVWWGKSTCRSRSARPSNCSPCACSEMTGWPRLVAVKIAGDSGITPTRGIPNSSSISSRLRHSFRLARSGSVRSKRRSGQVSLQLLQQNQKTIHAVVRATHRIVSRAELAAQAACPPRRAWTCWR